MSAFLGYVLTPNELLEKACMVPTSTVPSKYAVLRWIDKGPIARIKGGIVIAQHTDAPNAHPHRIIERTGSGTYVWTSILDNAPGEEFDSLEALLTLLVFEGYTTFY